MTPGPNAGAASKARDIAQAAASPPGRPVGTGAGPSAPTLLERLLSSPSRFGLDAAVAVMMRATKRSEPGDAVRFEAATGLAFAPSDIAEIRPAVDAAFLVRTGFMGLTGPGGVLPRSYTDIANTQARQRSGALSSFLDLLAQRPMAQFAQAGIKYRPHRAADAAAIQGNGPAAPRDGIREALLALVGHADAASLERLTIGPDPILFYAGLFAARPRSAGRLAAMLAEWLGRPVEAKQFVGAWIEIGRDQMTRLPRGEAGQFNRLGIDAAAGARAWDVGSQIVLHVGPLDEAQFRALLPGSALLARVAAFVQAYLGLEVAVVVNPILTAAAVPRPRLDAAGSCLLGFTGWLPMAGGRKEDAREARFRL